MWIKAGLFGAVMLAIGIMLGYFAAVVVLPSMLAAAAAQAAAAAVVEPTPSTPVTGDSVPPPPPPNSVYSESADIITDEMTYSAMSTDSMRDVGVSWALYCEAKGNKLTFAVQFADRLYMDRDAEAVSVYYRFDDEAATKASWKTVGDGQYVFPVPSGKFAERMQQAKRLRIRAIDSNFRQHDGKIALNGASETIGKVLAKCTAPKGT